jgi:putative iron-only hydrogenase system regulator
MKDMESRIALIGIFVENRNSTDRLNAILHEYGEYIIGRMGIPNAKQEVSVISIVLDAPNDVISALSGKIGMLPNVSAKTMYSKVSSESRR